MIRGRTFGPTCTFTPCSRSGSGAANTRRGPGCLRKQNWRTNSAAGPALPRGRFGHSSATGWPGRSSEQGMYRPARMLIHASRDGTVPPPPARRIRAAAVCISGRPPYTRVNRDHQQDLGSRTSAHPRMRCCVRSSLRARRRPRCQAACPAAVLVMESRPGAGIMASPSGARPPVFLALSWWLRAALR